MEKKIFASALNELKIGFEKGGRANKKHILVVSPAVEEYALSHGAQLADYAGEQPPVCPECNSGMNLRQGTQENSKFWSCSNSRCRGTHTYRPEWFFVGDVPVELEELVYKPPVVVDLQARAPQCPSCGGQMKLRSTRDGSRDFWSCMGFPACKGARNPAVVLDAETEKKPVQKPSNNKATSLLGSPKIVELIKYSIAVLGSENAAKKWLAKPNMYQLDGKSPFDVLATDEGRKKVRLMLKTLWD